MSNITTDKQKLAAFRFQPDEGDMVNLLKQKLEGMDSAASQLIPEIKIRNYEPWDLPGLLRPDNPYTPKAWFGFCRPDYKSIKSFIRKRDTKQGFWNITCPTKEIKSQQLANSVTCKKRTLIFRIGRGRTAARTRWFLYEYEFIKTGPGSKTNQHTNFVLCRIENKSADHQSDNKNLNESSISDELADSGKSYDSRGRARAGIPRARYVLPGSGNYDDAEFHGRAASVRYVDDMIQEPSAQPRKYVYPQPKPTHLLQLPQMGNDPDLYSHEYINWLSASGDNVLSRLSYKLAANVKFDNNMKFKDTSNCDDLADIVTGGSHLTSNSISEHEQVAAAENHRYMIPVAEKELAYQHAWLQNGNHEDDMIQKRDASFRDQGEPSSYNLSNCIDQVAAVVTAKSQDYSSTTLRTPINLELEDVLQANGINNDCYDMQSPFGDNNHYVTDNNDISTCKEVEPNSFVLSDDMIQKLCAQTEKSLASVMYIDVSNEEYKKSYENDFFSYTASDFENQATDNMIIEPCVHPPTYSEIRSVSNADAYNDDWSKWQSTFGDNYSHPTHKNNIISSNNFDQVSDAASSYGNQDKYESNYEVCLQQEESLESIFYRPEVHDYTLPPLMSSDVGDFMPASKCC